MALRRADVMRYFAAQSRCVVGMEACAGAHHWARTIGELGHDVRLMPPASVKPYVRRQKNDMTDAAAICEAVTRPSMRFVPVKSETRQALLLVRRARDLLVRQRTSLINALRAHLAEFEVVVPKGAPHVLLQAARHSETAGPWLARLLREKPRKVVAVALANKTARIVWALLARNEACRPAA